MKSVRIIFPYKPIHICCKNITTSYSCFVFQRRQQSIQLAVNVNQGETESALLYKEFEISIDRKLSPCDNLPFCGCQHDDHQLKDRRVYIEQHERLLV
jgi:hypothetical protein